MKGWAYRTQVLLTFIPKKIHHASTQPESAGFAKKLPQKVRKY